jgi:parallel beta-helix repeat protein
MRNKIFSPRSLFAIAILTLFAAMPLLGTNRVQAQSEPDDCEVMEVNTCGQVLSVAGEYVLTADLDCTGTAGDYNGITITASNVSLHLAGHTISSSDCDLSRNISGIFVAGGISNVKIDGGTVVGFNDGIVLSSSNSQVAGMTVRNACVFGILVQGQQNRVETCVVTGSGDGIMLSPASEAVITSNHCSSNTRAGIALSDFARDNTIENNILNNNGGDGGEGYGVLVYNGANNVIRNNTASNNNFGIRIHSALDRDGSPLPGNLVIGNTVSRNTRSGIWVQKDGSPSIIRSNRALGNGEVDMEDEIAQCGGNTWENNIFKTDLVGGVPDGGPCAGCIR